MYHRKIRRDEYQLSSVRDGVTKEVVNKTDLDMVIEMLTKTITSLFLRGKTVNVAVVSEDGEAVSIEVNSFTPSNY